MDKEVQQELLFSTENNILNHELKQIFESIQEQLDDHRESINDNTNEIQSNFEYLSEMNNRIDKLQTTVEEVLLLLKRDKKDLKEQIKIKALTAREKGVFFTIYTMTEAKKFVTYKELARKLGFTDQLVSSYVTAMLSKGVPILKKFSNGFAFVGLEENFRQIQAKKNIIGLDTRLSYWTQ